MEKLADIGVFGGSGFYKFLEDIKEVKVETPYGMPSDSLFIGKIGEHKVAFMPRHGRSHTILPHLINYRAKCLGNERSWLHKSNLSLRSGKLTKTR